VSTCEKYLIFTGPQINSKQDWEASTGGRWASCFQFSELPYTQEKRHYTQLSQGAE